MINQENNKQIKKDLKKGSLEKQARKLTKDSYFNLVLLVLLIILIIVFAFAALSNNKDCKQINVVELVKLSRGYKDKNYETKLEDDEKRLELIYKTIGEKYINFNNKNIPLVQIGVNNNNDLTMVYRTNLLEGDSDEELIITKHGKKANRYEIAQEIELIKSWGYGGKNLKLFEKQKNNTYFNFIIYYLIGSWHIASISDQATCTNVYLTGVSHRDMGVFSVTYKKTVCKDNDTTLEDGVEQWIKINSPQIIDKIMEVNLQEIIDFYNNNLKIKEGVSKSNLYNNISWENKVITEETRRSNIYLNYPQFNIPELDQTIKQLLLERIEESRKHLNDLIKYDKNIFKNLKEGEKYYLPCLEEEDIHLWQCRVDLSSEYRIRSIINDVITIEMTITDFTGAGNGNHDRVKIINYDLKNKKLLEVDELFCGENYLDNLANNLNQGIMSHGYGSWNLIEDEKYKNLARAEGVNFNDFGVIFIFQPYVISSGSDGIISILIPYSQIENNICLDGSNKLRLIEEEKLKYEEELKEWARLSEEYERRLEEEE